MKVLRQRGRGYDPQEIPISILRGEEFISGTLRGSPGYVVRDEYGQLPDEWVSIFTWDNPDYVVWSYETPIAWHVPGRYRDVPHWDEYRQQMVPETYIPEHWAFPDEKYSNTTGRHQGFVRRALAFSSNVISHTNERAEGDWES